MEEKEKVEKKNNNIEQLEQPKISRIESLEQRARETTNEGYIKPIWNAEKDIFNNIVKKIKKEKNYRISGTLGNPYVKKNKNGKEVTYWEYKWRDSYILSYGNARIRYQKNEDALDYYMYSEDTGEVLLGKVGNDEVTLPIYSDELIEGKFKQIEKLPLEDLKPTLRENIETTMRNHPVMRQYADMILNDFDQILCMDKRRNITPKSEERIATNIINPSKLAELDRDSKITESELMPIKQKGLKEWIKGLINKLMDKSEK